MFVCLFACLLVSIVPVTLAFGHSQSDRYHQQSENLSHRVIHKDVSVPPFPSVWVWAKVGLRPFALG